LAVLAVLAAAFVAESAAAGIRRPLRSDWGLLGPQPELDDASWLGAGIHQKRPFRLMPDRSLSVC
jgi:hypothetical protein